MTCLQQNTTRRFSMILKSSTTKWSPSAVCLSTPGGVLYNHLAMLATCDALLTWIFQLCLKNSTVFTSEKMCSSWICELIVDFHRPMDSFFFKLATSWCINLICYLQVISVCDFQLKLTNSRYARGTLGEHQFTAQQSGPKMQRKCMSCWWHRHLWDIERFGWGQWRKTWIWYNFR